jgi:hypothetical protein
MNESGQRTEGEVFKLFIGESGEMDGAMDLRSRALWKLGKSLWTISFRISVDYDMAQSHLTSFLPNRSSLPLSLSQFKTRKRSYFDEILKRTTHPFHIIKRGNS